jgi:hypothetical protein
MEPESNDLNYYTTLGKLGPTELGLDADGDVSVLAPGPDGQFFVVVIHAGTGGFSVHPITSVPMDWPVTKCKLMMAAVPISKEESDARDAERDAASEGVQNDVSRAIALLEEVLAKKEDESTDVESLDPDLDCDDELNNQIATERG